eukprot:GILJ01020605.1.p1 GENE.GILJ01020605.1~~GILJ01020605.1.p1  ORF type:complete len:523 (-),score=106.27 GILJ01020605.1:111-1679(-)
MSAGRNNNHRSEPHEEGSPQAPTPSGAPPSSASVAPLSTGGQSATIPRPPVGPVSARGLPFHRNGSTTSGGSANTPSGSTNNSPKMALEPLDFGDQQTAKGQGSATAKQPRTNSVSSFNTTGNTPRLPTISPRDNHFGDGTGSNDGSTYSARNRKSQRDALIENALKQHRNRAMQVQRSAQAAMLKDIKEEEQKKKAAEVQLRQMEEAKKRDEHMRMVHSANQLQAENRARRDEMLRQMRQENARAQIEMGELEVEAKAREIEEVRLKQQAVIDAKKEQTRLRNEMAMQQAKEKQHLLATRFEAALERKGLLSTLTEGPFGTNASGSQGGAGQEVMGESEMQRHMKAAEEQRRFQEKHQREAQRLATATEIAEQNRLKALLTIQGKEKKSKEHQVKEEEARDMYLSQNFDATLANLDRAKAVRQRQEEEARLYHEQLELERLETQALRDRRVSMEVQLKTEDRMARDEWRRSVLDRSKRYEEIKKLDAEEKIRAKQDAAEERMREIQAEIDAINAGQQMYLR